MKHKTILVAPLHWGLGHATRCIPIINALLEDGFQVLLGSDGAALALLKKEFPALPHIELPGYNITYPEDGLHFRNSMILQLPQLKAAANAEHKVVKKLVAEDKIQGIISDNRLGVYSKKVPSVYITHQLQVLSGNTTFFSSTLHQNRIKKFDECWVPDVAGKLNLSGKLGHPKKIHKKVTFIGPQSRLEKQELPISYDVLVILSGPEPQRSLLEEKLTLQLINTDRSVLLVKGLVEEDQTKVTHSNITVVNYLTTLEIQDAINRSNVVICRSGYTSIMDLAVMGKKAFLIPTPGQFEQEYLAKKLKKKRFLPSCKQDKFSLDKLEKLPKFLGLPTIDNTLDLRSRFVIFKSK